MNKSVYEVGYNAGTITKQYTKNNNYTNSTQIKTNQIQQSNQ